MIAKLRFPVRIVMIFLAGLWLGICLGAVLTLGDDERATMVDNIAAISMSSLTILVGIGFLYYGVKLYVLLLQRYRFFSRR
jgi:hypothetical protein